METRLTIMVGGEAGQGVQTMGMILARAFAHAGFHVFADQDYESRVRGGHNFFRVRVADAEVAAASETVDILLALNEDTIEHHRGELAPGGVIICDESVATGTGDRFAVPLERLAEQQAGGRRMANTVALGVAAGVAGFDLAILSDVVRHQFGHGESAEDNVRAAEAGYEFARSAGRRLDRDVSPRGDGTRLLLNGNEAIALGAVAAGCTFMSAYPMTPATSIMEYLAGHSEGLGLAVVQAEDEIAAITMAVGAGFAGARALTATSGSGFCLMVEGLGLAAITETPLVIVDAQRPGPAVGLPTRTEQGDLLFALHAHHDDAQRAVLAPGDVAEAFWLTVKAFNIAERYQVPVILLTDQHLASSYTTVDRFDLSQVSIDRGALLSAAETDGDYRRHLVTPDGVSPRALPLQGPALVVTDSDEHDEWGHLTEAAATRTEQVLKRQRKLDGLRQEVAPPYSYGPPQAEVTLIGWGSTRGALREAVDSLRGEGLDVAMLHVSELWPFPATQVAEALQATGRCFTVENNASGQLARLIRAETGKAVTGSILKFDGRPFTPASIARELKREGVA